MSQILVDANVFSYGTNEKYSDAIANVFERLAQLKHEPAVLSYTSFEVYRGLDFKRVPKMKLLVDAFTPVDIDLKGFKIAAALYSCYKKHPTTKAYTYQDGDIVTAAGAFLYNTLVLTADGNDFPRPFFDDVEKFPLKMLDGRVPLIVSLLQPNIQCFNGAIKEYLSAGK
jgi:predicted nucleic acid-binding protein